MSCLSLSRDRTAAVEFDGVTGMSSKQIAGFDGVGTDKRVVCHYKGGPNDGSFASDSGNPREAQMVEMHYCLTRGGEIGKCHNGVSIVQYNDLKTMAQLGKFGVPTMYKVVDRSETESEINIYHEHVPNAGGRKAK